MMPADDLEPGDGDACASAKRYLREQARRMAQNVVENGKPREHVRVLEGLRVLDDADAHAGIQITITGFTLAGISAPPATALLPIVEDGHDD